MRLKSRLPHIGKFPRDYRFILGDRMQNCPLNICGLLIEVRFGKEKREILNRANIELDKLRYMVRLCKYLKLMDFRRYEYAAEAINGIGVYVGGWLKKTGKRGQ